MYSKSVVIKNTSGLHARPAADFVAAAKKFQSGISIAREEKPEEKVNAKSIISLLTMGITKDTRVRIVAEGTDEKEAVEELCAQIEKRFGEEG